MYDVIITYHDDCMVEVSDPLPGGHNSDYLYFDNDDDAVEWVSKNDGTTFNVVERVYS